MYGKLVEIPVALDQKHQPHEQAKINHQPTPTPTPTKLRPYHAEVLNTPTLYTTNTNTNTNTHDARKKGICPKGANVLHLLFFICFLDKGHGCARSLQHRSTSSFKSLPHDQKHTTSVLISSMTSSILPSPSIFSSTDLMQNSTCSLISTFFNALSRAF